MLDGTKADVKSVRLCALNGLRMCNAMHRPDMRARDNNVTRARRSRGTVVAVMTTTTTTP